MVQLDIIIVLLIIIILLIVVNYIFGNKKYNEQGNYIDRCTCGSNIVTYLDKGMFNPGLICSNCRQKLYVQTEK